MNVASAARWTSRARRSVTRAIATVRPDECKFGTNDFDVVPLSDEAAAPICARHDEIGTNRPVFVGQDKVKRYALSERERERRTGTPWYREWPQRLLHTEYHRWRTSRGIAKQS
ncbi:pectate lyase [Lacipirellula limnantheis]|uniref:pectate lyase n=1 Tax=Lacipirellula limnantheis TaxID=2528024 RepID=UPI001AEF3C67|nr:pectate lyase [Lacipirellula limnantheis]